MWRQCFLLMIKTIVTVCTGNICRSPVAEAALRARLPNIEVRSAGMHALVGREIDPDSQQAAVQLGIPLAKHSARQFDFGIGREADLILVMDRGHLDEIRRKFPEFTGKSFLLRHHFETKDVPDPYRLGIANHYRAVEVILEGSHAWAKQIEQLLD